MIDLGFTGIDAPYQLPVNPDLIVDTSAISLDRCIELIIEKLAERVSLSMSYFVNRQYRL